MGEPLNLGRYTLFAELASGGMATVYLARLNGEVGFGRTVAIKRLHPHLVGEQEFLAMFLDEARLAARIQHPNVVTTLDVVTEGRELFIVMEYVKGESLSRLLRFSQEAGQSIPIPVATAIGIQLLSGLHAAHEAHDENGYALSIVHRDVSPQNVLVGVDGVTRVLDFGIAKATTQLHTTREGQVKGKLAYMSPEQIFGAEVTRATDIYASGVVLWESLACRRLFQAETDGAVIKKILDGDIKPPSLFNPEVPPELDRVVLKALSKDAADRYATAHQMAEDVDQALHAASNMKVSQWVTALAGKGLAARSELVAEIESVSSGAAPVQDHLQRLSGSRLPEFGAATPAATAAQQATAIAPLATTGIRPLGAPPAPPPPLEERTHTVVTGFQLVSSVAPTHAAPARPRRVAGLLLAGGAFFAVAVGGLVWLGVHALDTASGSSVASAPAIAATPGPATASSGPAIAPPPPVTPSVDAGVAVAPTVRPIASSKSPALAATHRPVNPQPPRPPAPTQPPAHATPSLDDLSRTR
jgi:serine/threonine protein kinase